ncbi:hypothetical protein NLJ89_g9378 [Agrocybe chaxingu]|uniref:Uncharacterized protein n=1 Tax=Agrocybe chaxingu TaxID=84603 RepID=A0A9W8JVY4_9AGAR|nr:hypothetical protein NLJ89_g9378 [Agrocybe chaxingu]
MQGYRDVPVVDPVQGALYSFDTPQNTPPPAMNPHSHAFPSTAPTTTTSAGYYPGSDRDNRLTYDTGRSVGPPTASPQSAQRNTQLFLPSPTSSPPPASAPVREDEDDGAGTQAGPSHSSPTSSSGLTIRIPPSSYRGKGKERERSHIHVRRAKKDKEEDESE